MLSKQLQNGVRQKLDTTSGKPNIQDKDEKLSEKKIKLSGVIIQLPVAIGQILKSNCC